MRRWLYGLSKAEIQDKLQTMQWEWVLPRGNKEQGSSLRIAPVLKMKNKNTEKYQYKDFFPLDMEVAEKVIFFRAPATKGGLGVRAWQLR